MSWRLMRLSIRALDSILRHGKYNPEAVPDHLITGKRGEEEAYFYLRQHGYVMAARNWRSSRMRGEIDLIGWDGDVLCFVEVKTRTTRDVKPAEAAVDNQKQRLLKRAANEYLRQLANQRRFKKHAKGGEQATPAGETLTGLPTHRFDIVSVYYGELGGRITDITLFRNAFSVA